MSKMKFGTTKDGQEVYRYILTNKNHMEAHVTNYGAILLDLLVPDKQGNVADVVLGYDNVQDYEVNSSFFGATVGPSANRIAGASFSLDETLYKLPVNDGPNNLHSDFDLGVHKRVWSAIESDNSITFVINLKDQEMGFPGNKEIMVTYTLTEENALEILYKGTTDKNTLFNMTNHSYFNLKGHNQGDIHDHELELCASFYTPVLEGAIPTGECASVAGTVFDFTTPKKMGKQIQDDVEQLKLVQGYDHNFIIDGWNGTLKKAAIVKEETTGRVMEVYTDLPGIQFYAGNCIGTTIGKENTTYGPRTGFCLETQYYPNSANEASFPQPFTDAGSVYETKTIYKFFAE